MREKSLRMRGRNLNERRGRVIYFVENKTRLIYYAIMCERENDIEDSIAAFGYIFESAAAAARGC